MSFICPDGNKIGGELAIGVLVGPSSVFKRSPVSWVPDHHCLVEAAASDFSVDRPGHWIGFGAISLCPVRGR